MKLKWKIVIGFTVVVIIIGVFQGIYFQYKIEQKFEEYILETESEKITPLKNDLLESFDYYGEWRNPEEILYYYQTSTMGMGQNRMRQGMGMNSAHYSLANKDGVVIASTMEHMVGELESDLTGMKESLILNGIKIGSLIISEPLNNRLMEIQNQYILTVKESIFYGTLLMVVTAALLAFVLAAKMTRPLHYLMSSIEKISKGEHDYRVKLKTNDEFEQLGYSFNNLLDQLEKNEKIRKMLVDDVAHELRTPLTILRGKLESIQEGALEPSEETILRLHDEVYRLSRLVNELQQLSLTDAGILPLNKIKTNIGELIERVMEQLQWLADEKGITLYFDKPSTPCILSVDQDKMTQVFINLIGNALQHTNENGKVNIFIGSAQNCYEIEISDDGPGIEEEHLQYIFERFYRTEKSRTRSGGQGLGLSIAKGYVEAHGGKIRVTSKKSIGTTFTIFLPKEK
ncbi:ATP-binding protein [Bacillaceae bacterium S4-13-56]